ncbi:MAG: Rrf2 family transcriptional regulator [Planctomycetes bacterium]|nr:Rrf2 family transcriptional regulator [Planctomycetota bacterium]
MKVSKATAYSLHALMYMVRHLTQLPATINIIAKAEGIPPRYLAKIFQRLVAAGFVKTTRSKNKGYVFAKLPEEISLLELFELIEGEPLFGNCLLRHCECGGTADNCDIFAKWLSCTKKIKQLLSDTSLVTATWNHPEHRFHSLPESLKAVNRKPETKAAKVKAKAKVKVP